jgi:hypothetical protein
MPWDQVSVPPPGSNFSNLDQLRQNSDLSAHAAALIDNMDPGLPGFRHYSNTSSSHWSWAHQGGDNALKVCT